MREFALASLALAACTSSSGPDHAGATHAFNAANTRMEAAVNALNTSVASLTGTVSATAPCGLAGSVGLTGSYEATGTGTNLDLTAAFAGCKEAEGLLEGRLQFTSTTDGATVREAWHGTLDFSDASGHWQCLFDFRATLGATGVTYAGSICGYDAATELRL